MNRDVAVAKFYLRRCREIIIIKKNIYKKLKKESSNELLILQSQVLMEICTLIDKIQKYNVEFEDSQVIFEQLIGD